MSADYSFVGAVNRDNAMSAVADTMNSLTLDILKATMEMGGKQVVEKDGNAYALERLDASEVKGFKDDVSSQTFYAVGAGSYTLGGDGKFYDSGVAKDTVTVDSKVYTFNTTSKKYETEVTAAAGSTPAVMASLDMSKIATNVVYTATPITQKDVADAIFDILGINPKSDIEGGIDGSNWKISMNSDGSNVTMKVAYVDANTGDTMIMGVKLDKDGACVGLSALDNKNGLSLDNAIASDDLVISDVNGGGLLESWGITNPEELQPGDLFLVQQKLQIIKDTVSAVHTTGKTQGDIMREATQKFAQG